MGKNGTNAGHGAVKCAWFYTLTTHKPISHIELSQDVIMTAIGTAAFIQNAREKMPLRASTVDIAIQMAVICVLLIQSRIATQCMRRARETAYMTNLAWAMKEPVNGTMTFIEFVMHSDTA